MKKFITSLLVIVPIMVLSGCGKEPIRIESAVMTSYMGPIQIKYPRVTVTAMEEDVTIEDIIANDGNCKAGAFNTKLPKTLKFGEQVERDFITGCNVVKVEVVTNKGAWSVSY